MAPLFRYLAAVTIPVPDLDAGLTLYCGALGHRLLWRNEARGQAGLIMPESQTEIVLSTQQGYQPN